MPKILIAVAVSLLSFIAGLAGLYYALPIIAPERVAEMMGDTLATPPENTVADALELPTAAPPATGTPPAEAATDSAGTAPAATAEASPENLPRTIAEMSAALADTVSSLRQQLAEAQAEAAAHERTITALRADIDSLQYKPKVDIAELTRTLSKLEDRELKNLLGEFDLELLGEIYINASGRSRVRLLQSMPSERAANFVRNLRGDSRPARSRSAQPSQAAEPTPAPEEG